jgi:hypothetical protein
MSSYTQRWQEANGTEETQVAWARCEILSYEARRRHDHR